MAAPGALASLTASLKASGGPFGTLAGVVSHDADDVDLGFSYCRSAIECARGARLLPSTCRASVPKPTRVAITTATTPAFPGERPTVVVAHLLADSSLERRIVRSQQIAELVHHARKRRPDTSVATVRSDGRG